MGVRIKDIAEKANVSPATVSLVLNNKPGISEETRQRVLAVVEELGYSTNMLSKPALNNQGNIRMVIYKKHGNVVSDTPFFSALMEGIEKEARREGYNLIVSYINEKQNNKMEVIRILEQNPMDGVLLLATEMTREDLAPFKKLGTPVVALDNYLPMEKIDAIVINNRQGAYEAVKYLIDYGHRAIGYLHSSVWINNFDERKEGFFKALTDHNIRFDKKFIFELESTHEGAYRDMLEALDRGANLPTAFFADNDIIALGAIKALKERGYSVPKDVSVVGFDDMPFCEMIDPPLTTCRVYKERIGAIAVKRLLEKMGGEAEEVIKLQVETKLIKRLSVTPA